MKKESVTVNMDEVFAKIARRRAKIEGRSLSGMIAFAARRYFEVTIKTDADINGKNEDDG